MPASVSTTVPVSATAVAPGSVAPPAAPPQVAAPAADRAAPEKISTATRQTVTGLRYWTPALVALRVTRDDAFAFTPGHYARLGITDADGSVVFRPLSIASAPADRELEFVCTLIPGGEFSTRLAALRVGDAVEVDGRSYGFLTVDSLAPGADLWLLASGTGLAPFLSMLRDLAVWQAFERLVVVHSVRQAAELAYADELRHLAQVAALPPVRALLRYVPVVTREPGPAALSDRIPALIADGRLAAAAGTTLDPARSRVMVCGNPAMTRELRELLGDRGFRTSRRAAPGQAAFEKYW